MKKRILQQITCLILVIALAMPLCACGSSAGKAGNENAALANKIIRIVTEESEAFFAGDKTALEIAGVIQNRVRLYLDENRK